MKFYADLHLHSSYSRATSRELTHEMLYAWGLRKGIGLIGTGDCLHPAWFAACAEKLQLESDGLYSLKPGYSAATKELVPASCAGAVRFLPTVEISNIYKKDGKVRKVHNLVCLPDLTAVEKLVARLERIGNLKSDGRPILGLDSRDLAETVLDTDPRSMLIPAHIWTPWFSALGSKSGFDSIQECYGDMTKAIYAVETGLSSDPAMNWQLSSLDPFALVSFSDAHSPSKLGRESTLFDTDLSYDGVFRALADPADRGLAGTVEFFPEEGKYHVDGHRNCGVRLSPEETVEHKGICPVCGKPLTVGVMSRVMELSDREPGTRAPRGKPFKSLVPLTELIGEAFGVGPESKSATQCYEALLTAIGGEFTVLLDAEVAAIAAVAGDLVAEGVRRVRNGQLSINPGYDGEFGTVKIFTDAEREQIVGQTDLFGMNAPKIRAKARKSPVGKKKNSLTADRSDFVRPASEASGPPDILSQTNAEQRSAILHDDSPLLIVAGPGTGKTHTLTRRIARSALGLTPPKRCLAITFTNKAAEELRLRIGRFGDEVASNVFAGTIHAFCLMLLRDHGAAIGLAPTVSIATPEELTAIAAQAWPQATVVERRALIEETSRCKGRCPGEEGDPDFVASFDAALAARNRLDFDSILRKVHELLTVRPDVLAELHKNFPFIFIDEYQDLSEIQHALVVLLAGSSGTVTAIGDPHQAIYGFRGSNPAYFGAFTNDFPRARVLSLVENYRTSPVILRAFGQVIAKSPAYEPLPLVPAAGGEGRLIVHATPSEKAEVEFVIHSIERHVGGTSMFSRDSGRVGDSAFGTEHFGFGDIAVLYRVNSLRGELEAAFKRSGIPFTVAGEKPFCEHPFVSRLLRYLKFSSGEGIPVESFVNMFARISPGFDAAGNSCAAAWRAKGRNDVTLPDLPDLFSSSVPYAQSTQREAASFQSTAEEIGTLLSTKKFTEALSLVTSLKPWKEESLDDPEAQDDLVRLHRFARISGSFRQFMDAVFLLREEDGLWQRSEAVALMTLHAAKGLEWPVVFIIGCEEGIIPHARSGASADGEEERRLLYVGMSRAKSLLYLTHAETRFFRGERRACAPSPFLADIDVSLQTRPDPEHPYRKRGRPDAEQLTLPL
jgi:DNA helicase II / ATP-dependent DNA helicase PcrA